MMEMRPKLLCPSILNLAIDNIREEVEKLDELGLSELLEIAQARYDRYLANLPS